MSNYLAISVLGENRADLVATLARTISDCKCNIQDSRMSVLGESCGLILLVGGSWNTLAKLETQLQRLGQEQDLAISVRRTGDGSGQTDLRPYSVEVSALDQPGIVQKVVGFFDKRQISLLEMAARRYEVTQTATSMAVLSLVVGVPASVHIGLLREEFMDFCDDFNWDAVLEPLKP